MRRLPQTSSSRRVQLLCAVAAVEITPTRRRPSAARRGSITSSTTQMPGQQAAEAAAVQWRPEAPPAPARLMETAMRRSRERVKPVEG